MKLHLLALLLSISSCVISEDPRPTFATPGSPDSKDAIVRLPLLPAPSLDTETASYLDWPSSGFSIEERNELAANILTKLKNYEAAKKQQEESKEVGNVNSAETEEKLVMQESLRELVTKQLAGNTRPPPGASRLGIIYHKKEMKEVMQLQYEIHAQIKAFMGIAKEMVPSLSNKDIKRASGNLWPMLCIQALNGKKLKITDSMIGYSMLYPLTDDLVDDQSIPKEQKKSFIERFIRLISHGDTQPNPDIPQEIDVWRMFALIENEWDRSKHPETYRILTELFDAQKDSQLQFGGPKLNKPVPTFEDVWGITVRKGALSILGDAYLVLGKPHKYEASFAAHFGAITQFMNDIKSIDSDYAEGQYTTFNLVYYEKHQKLDHLTDVILNYFQTTFTNEKHLEGSNYEGHATTHRESLFRVMLSFLSYKFIEGISLNQDKYSPEFLEKIDSVAGLPLELVEKLFKMGHGINDEQRLEVEKLFRSGSII